MRIFKQFFLILLAMFCSAILHAAGNILKNPELQRLGSNGMPERWTLTGGEKAAFSIIPGGFTITGPAAFSQGDLDVTPGTRMNVSCKVAGDGSFRIMIDWPGTKTPPVNAHWEEFTEGWKQITQFEEKERNISFEFMTPAGVSNPPRLTLEAGRGRMEFKESSVREADIPMALGRPWKLTGNSKMVLEDGTLSVELGFQNFDTSSAVLPGVQVKPDTWYELSFEAKAGKKRTSRGGHCPYRIDIKPQGAIEAISSEWFDLPGQAYHKRTFRFKNIGAVLSTDIGFGVLPYPVSIRNVSMKAYTPEPLENAELILDSPHSRNSFYHSLPEQKIEGRVLDVDGTAVAGTATLILNGKNIGSEQLTLDAQKNLVFSMDASKLSDGEYQLDVQIYTQSGKITRKLTAPIHKLPRAPNEVVCGPDNHYYINGKRFVPIMVGSIPGNSDEAYRFAAAHGVNCIGMVGKDDEAGLFELLEQARKYGIMVRLFTYFPVTEAGFDSWVALQKQRLSKRVLNHPALLCHFMVDEPYECGYPLEMIRRSYDRLRELDPYHPIHINLGPPGTITAQRHFTRFCDSTGVDIYPVGGPWHSSLPDKTQTCVEEYAKRYCEVAQHRKTITMVLQGYSWGEDSATEIPKKVLYPTSDDLRLMTFLAFWGGTNNVQYYSVERISRPEQFYPVFFAFTKELHQVLPLLLDGKCASDHTDAQKIRIRRVEYAEATYVFVLNMSGVPVEAKFELPFGGKTVLSAFENRNLEPQDGIYSVKLPPYGTRLYSADPLPKTEPLPEYTGNDPDPWTTIRRKAVKAMMGTPYSGKANWIWSSEKARQIAGCHVWLARKIQISKAVQSAEIMFATDDTSTVFLDGIHIAKNANWVQMTSGDLTAGLKKQGEHVLLVYAQDGNLLPCGFIAEIRIHYADGSNETIVTDASWVGTEDRQLAEQVRMNQNGLDGWHPGEIIGPFGCFPWKDQIKLPKE